MFGLIRTIVFLAAGLHTVRGGNMNGNNVGNMAEKRTVLVPGSSQHAGNSLSSPFVQMRPLHMDMTGVLLGSMVGFGTVLLIPKVLEMFYPFAMYPSQPMNPFSKNTAFSRRSDPNIIESIVAEATNYLTNSTLIRDQCPYKLICSTMHQTRDRLDNFLTVAQLIGIKKDQFIDKLPGGQLLKESIELGLTSGRSCNRFYSNCPIDVTQMESFTKSLWSKMF